ncbi:VTT domain-containing protein [Candidatus Pacearchaeota archaeon]|nr:VTT domain-containing protein [Candidatus Pacearchaeota archaeon]
MELIYFFLNLESNLNGLVDVYGVLIYFILFLIIALETGTVIAPVLPGDSLIFVTGALAAQGTLSLVTLFFVFFSAAVFGDAMNYWIGYRVGMVLFRNPRSKVFKREYLERTKRFYAEHGTKTIIIARFIPIIRSFAPFVAGMGKMNYIRFSTYNIIGGFLWVSLFLIGGFLFGNIPFVGENLWFFIILIVMISFTPIIIELYHRRKRL